MLIPGLVTGYWNTYFIDKSMLLHLSLSSEVLRFNKYFIHSPTSSCSKSKKMFFFCLFFLRETQLLAVIFCVYTCTWTLHNQQFDVSLFVNHLSGPLRMSLLQWVEKVMSVGCEWKIWPPCVCLFVYIKVHWLSSYLWLEADKNWIVRTCTCKSELKVIETQWQ